MNGLYDKALSLSLFFCVVSLSVKEWLFNAQILETCESLL